MAQSRVVTLTQAEQDELLDKEVVEQAKAALGHDSPFWDGILKFVGWLRGIIKDLLTKQLSKLPIVGKWASRIGSTISEFCFSVLGSMLHFLKIVFSTPEVWRKAHSAAMTAWSANDSNGLLAQIYAYSKKMSGYYLEIIKQCLERAIVAHGLQVTSEDKEEIASLLGDILDS